LYDLIALAENIIISTLCSIFFLQFGISPRVFTTVRQHYSNALLQRYIYIRVQSKSRKVTKEGFVSSLRQRSSREKKSCVGDDDRGDFFAFSFLDKIIGEDF
tara:strand:+ start:158 stop:463 length:306 start_codon:yes stop_codon:yes gene_type:complete